MMERVKSWDWNMLIFGLFVGAMGLALLLERPVSQMSRAGMPSGQDRSIRQNGEGTPLTPRLRRLLSDGDR
jgi:hypothetical protein